MALRCFDGEDDGAGDVLVGDWGFLIGGVGDPSYLELCISDASLFRQHNLSLAYRSRKPESFRATRSLLLYLRSTRTASHFHGSKGKRESNGVWSVEQESCVYFSAACHEGTSSIPGMGVKSRTIFQVFIFGPQALARCDC